MRRLARRAREARAALRAAALAQAKRTVDAAETLAGEYQDHKRTQADVYAELRRAFPWLNKDLAIRLGDYGFLLAIM